MSTPYTAGLYRMLEKRGLWDLLCQYVEGRDDPEVLTDMKAECARNNAHKRNKPMRIIESDAGTIPLSKV